jgi:hypothetical protein
MHFSSVPSVKSAVQSLVFILGTNLLAAERFEEIAMRMGNLSRGFYFDLDVFVGALCGLAVRPHFLRMRLPKLRGRNAD